MYLVHYQAGLKLLETIVLVITATSFIASLSEAITCSGHLSTAEYDALYQLYNVTNGPAWTYTEASPGNPWIFPSSINSPCTDNWSGISCDFCTKSDNYTITSIKLLSSGMYLADSYI
jgi:hypothetical protein